ncbi:hypothetical protein BDZ45DRAFT_89144 [Acephala macrosclerotiorum]|nr:hypothetical protein BDZ45DRAFT_89144 [Acephala macrosclerotiorum]
MIQSLSTYKQTNVNHKEYIAKQSAKLRRDSSGQVLQVRALLHSPSTLTSHCDHQRGSVHMNRLSHRSSCSNRWRVGLEGKGGVVFDRFSVLGTSCRIPSVQVLCREWIENFHPFEGHVFLPARRLERELGSTLAPLHPSHIVTQHPTNPLRFFTTHYQSL